MILFGNLGFCFLTDGAESSQNMIIIAEIWLQAFAAIQTVEFYYKISQLLGSVMLQLRTCLCTERYVFLISQPPVAQRKWYPRTSATEGIVVLWVQRQMPPGKA